MFVSLSANSNNQSVVEECKASRNAVSREMCAEIQEIIRVLQMPSSTDKPDTAASESALRHVLVNPLLCSAQYVIYKSYLLLGIIVVLVN